MKRIAILTCALMIFVAIPCLPTAPFVAAMIWAELPKELVLVFGSCVWLAWCVLTAKVIDRL